MYFTSTCSTSGSIIIHLPPPKCQHASNPSHTTAQHVLHLLNLAPLHKLSASAVRASLEAPCFSFAPKMLGFRVYCNMATSSPAPIITGPPISNPVTSMSPTSCGFGLGGGSDSSTSSTEKSVTASLHSCDVGMHEPLHSASPGGHTSAQQGAYSQFVLLFGGYQFSLWGVSVPMHGNYVVPSGTPTGSMPRLYNTTQN